MQRGMLLSRMMLPANHVPADGNEDLGTLVGTLKVFDDDVGDTHVIRLIGELESAVAEPDGSLDSIAQSALFAVRDGKLYFTGTMEQAGEFLPPANGIVELRFEVVDGAGATREFSIIFVMDGILLADNTAG